MKRLLIIALGGLLAGSLAVADQENSSSSEESTSHNPITGSDTVTKTKEHKVKDARGAKHKMKTKEKTTHKSNGGTETKSTTEESNTPAD